MSVLTTIEVTQDEDLKYRLRAGDVLMTEGGDRDKLGVVVFGMVRLSLAYTKIIFLRFRQARIHYFQSSWNI